MKQQYHSPHFTDEEAKALRELGRPKSTTLLTEGARTQTHLNPTSYFLPAC